MQSLHAVGCHTREASSVVVELLVHPASSGKHALNCALREEATHGRKRAKAFGATEELSGSCHSAGAGSL